MNMQRAIAIIMLGIGFLGLAYGGFSYTSDVHNAELGSLQLSFSEKERVNIPIWAGVAFILVGGVLLVMPRKN